MSIHYKQSKTQGTTQGTATHKAQLALLTLKTRMMRNNVK